MYCLDAIMYILGANMDI